MLTEKKWPSVIFTPISVANSVITVANVYGLHPKQQITLFKTGFDPLVVEVKRILSKTEFYVGPTGGKITKYLDPVDYDGGMATVDEQDRNVIDANAGIRASYAEEPTVALRTVGVDYYGNYIDSIGGLADGHNRFMVDAHSSAVNTSTRVYDSIRIGDQNNELVINPGGSINVNVISATLANETQRNFFNEALAVPSGIETSIVSYTVPTAKAKLQRVSFSGQSIGTYNLYVNSTKIDAKHTWFNGPMFGDFTFVGGAEEGQTFVFGDKIELKIFHNRTSGDFVGRIQVIEII